MELALAGSFILVLLYNVFFYQIPTGIGFGFFILLLNLFFLFSARGQQTNKLIGITYSTLATIFAFLLAYKSNFLVQAIDLFATIFFSLTALFAYRFQEPTILKITTFLTSPLEVIGNALVNFSDNLKVREYENFRKKLTDEAISALTRGIIIAIPVVVILFIVLQTADPIFAKLSTNFFKSIGTRLIISTLLFVTFLVLGIVRIRKEIRQRAEAIIAQTKSLELTIVVGAVALLFATFITVQFKYLFSDIGERQLQEIGVESLTYSEYVRKGFFELLLASAIASAVIIYGLKAKKLATQILLAILNAETFLILLSAAQRLNLYGQDHGLTRARIFGFDFLLWLGAILLILLLQVFSKLKRESVFAITLCVSTVALFSVNLINIDALIAINFRPTVNSEIDYSYIASLSPDAYQSWREIIETSAQTVSQMQKKEPSSISQDDLRKLELSRLSLLRLQIKTTYLVEKYAPEQVYSKWPQEIKSLKRQRAKWHSKNIAEYAAYKEIENNIQIYGQIFQIKNQIQTQPVPLDRPVEAPLTF